MSQIHPEILDTDRLDVFHQLVKCKQFGYLAGGTALALQINHRKSFDFDIFVPEQIGNSLRRTIKTIFGDRRHEVDTADQITFTGPNNIQITFLWYYFKPLFPLIPTESISLSTIGDIAADKAMTIGRRAVWRDYVDIYVLLSQKYVTLTTIIQHAKKKFGTEFIETQFLEQLTYYQDITIVPIDFIGKSVETTEIQTFLTKEVANYLDNNL